MKIFYAWQSDRDEKLNRYFIRDALKLAIKPLASLPEIEDAPELDYDTKDVPGSPNIAETIVEKIQACGLFVADLSFVGQVEKSSDARPRKLIPNPNVLIELGFAASLIGWERIILVMNTAFGSRDYLPFDLRHRRQPIQYSLSDASQSAEAKVDLADSLRTAIKSVIESGAVKPKDAVSLRCGAAIVARGTDVRTVFSVTMTNVSDHAVVISEFGLLRSDGAQLILPPVAFLRGWPVPKRLEPADYASIEIYASWFLETMPEFKAQGLTLTHVVVRDSFNNLYKADILKTLVDEMVRK